jgi:uncharacterized phage-like protein YoqJ
MQLNLLQPQLDTVAGTGHRPDRLSLGKIDPYNPILRERLTDLAIWYLEKKLPDQVISGMALGWDVALAIAAIKLEIPLIAAVPFKGQERLWSAEDKHLYYKVLQQAKQVVIVCDGGYEAKKLMIRNRWMVDKCSRVIALYDGSQAGGTANCIKYAAYKNKPIDNLWGTYIKVNFGY